MCLFPVCIFSLSKKEYSYSELLEKSGEKAPLLSGNIVKVENGGSPEEVKEETVGQTQKDFQTIRVPESGRTVREFMHCHSSVVYRHVQSHLVNV